MEKTASHKPWIIASVLRGSASWLAILGAALYWSWMDNAMFSDLLFTIFHNDHITANLANLGFSCTLLASAAVLIVTLFTRMQLFESKVIFPLKAMGVLGLAGVIGNGAMMLAGAFSNTVVGVGSAILVGLVMGVMQILWGKVCIAQGHRRALIHISGAWACGFFINALIENLVPLTRGLFVVALPLLTVIVFIALGKLQDSEMYRIDWGCVDCDAQHESLKTHWSKWTVVGVDWSLPLFTLVFCIAFGFMYSLEVFPTTVDNPANAFRFIAFRGLTALTLFVISLTPLVSHISTVFVACLSLMAAGVLALTVQVFTGATQTLGAILIASGYAGFDALIWTLIAYFGGRSKKTAVKIIALVIGAEQIGIFAGDLLGSSVINHAIDATLFIAFMYIFLLAAFGLTQLSSRVLGENADENTAESTSECEKPEGQLSEAQLSEKAAIGEAEQTRESLLPGTMREAAEVSPGLSITDSASEEPSVALTRDLNEGQSCETSAAGSTATPLAAFICEYGLTAREQEILVPFCEGRSVPYVAKMLFLSENTVKSHLRHIYTKCEVHNKQALLDLVRSYENNEK